MTTSRSSTQNAPQESTGDRRQPGVERVATGGAVWAIVSGSFDRLLATGAPDWFALERDLSALKIKSGLERTIWRVDQADSSLICKVYRPQRFWRRMATTHRRTPARREFEAARQARRLGVPVPEAVAWGRQTVPSFQSVVVSQALPSAVPLEEIAPNSANVRSIVEALAGLFAQAHNAGCTHRDGHPGNLMLRHDPDGQWKAWFVDLHGLQFVRGRLSTRQVAESLGQLEHYYAPVVSRCTRLRFLAHYVKCRSSHLDGRALARLVHQAARAHAVRLAWRRDRRLRIPGKYFTQFDVGDGWTAWVVLKLARRRLDPAPHMLDRSPDQWRDILSRIPAAVQSHPYPANSPSFELPGDGISLDIMPVRSLTERLRATLLGTPARRAFEHAHRLRHRDIHSSVPLGYAERRLGPLVLQSVLIHPIDSDRTNRPDHREDNG